MYIFETPALRWKNNSEDEMSEEDCCGIRVGESGGLSA